MPLPANPQEMEKAIAHLYDCLLEELTYALSQTFEILGKDKDSYSYKKWRMRDGVEITTKEVFLNLALKRLEYHKSNADQKDWNYLLRHTRNNLLLLRKHFTLIQEKVGSSEALGLINGLVALVNANFTPENIKSVIRNIGAATGTFRNCVELLTGEKLIKAIQDDTAKYQEVIVRQAELPTVKLPNHQVSESFDSDTTNYDSDSSTNSSNTSSTLDEGTPPPRGKPSLWRDPFASMRTPLLDKKTEEPTEVQNTKLRPHS